LLVHGLRGGLQTGVAGNQLVPLHRVLDSGQQFLPQPRLDDEPVNLPLVDRVNDRAQAQDGGDEDAGGVGLDFAHLRQEFQARDHGHLLVGDDDRELLFLEHAQGMDGVRGSDHAVALAQQGVAQGHQHDLLVVHDENGTGGGGFSG
jgi:hypothetical protein